MATLGTDVAAESRQADITLVSLEMDDMKIETPEAPSKSTVLIVDDTPENLALMHRVLCDEYRTRVAHNGATALDVAFMHEPPDLVLLDIMMPDMDGYEVCRRLKADLRTKHVPIIFLTVKADVDNEQKGFDVGAVDYITKPVSPPILKARVRTQLVLKRAADFLKDKNAFLEQEVAKRTREVQVVQDVTIMAMASIAETRDNETGNHLRRTQNYVRVLAERLRSHPKFARLLDDSAIEMLFKSAPLHDIGKVGIPDAILLKPGKLTMEEFEIMKTHTTLGCDMIAAAEKHMDAPSTFLRLAREIAHYHQEKWDGSGYPDGLAGDAIPLSARLMAVADVYDALISCRVYKPAFSREMAFGIMLEGRGTHFDPDIFDTFVDVEPEFAEIGERYSDNEADVSKKNRLI